MRRALIAACVGALALAAPASAATSKNFTFQSRGTAVQPGAVAGTGTPGSYEDFPFTIKPGERNGTATIGILWDDPFDDWDLYVYKKSGSTLEPVASAADGAPDDGEVATIQSTLDAPIEAGQYLIRVQNYASSNPSYRGTVKFGPFNAPNKKPRAKLKVRPRKASSRKRVKIDARGSKDPDGKIASYAFDLNGDGAMETSTGKRRFIRRRFKPGLHFIGVRVTDNKGARSYATARLAVFKARRRGRR